MLYEVTLISINPETGERHDDLLPPVKQVSSSSLPEDQPGREKFEGAGTTTIFLPEPVNRVIHVPGDADVVFVTNGEGKTVKAFPFDKAKRDAILARARSTSSPSVDSTKEI